jgi:hypothetical protein
MSIVNRPKWEPPRFLEVNMNAEIGSYQGDSPDESPIAEPVLEPVRSPQGFAL